jgi:hypothetical protein
VVTDTSYSGSSPGEMISVVPKSLSPIVKPAGSTVGSDMACTNVAIAASMSAATLRNVSSSTLSPADT